MMDELAERMVSEFGLSGEVMFGGEGVMQELKRRVVEKMLEGEMTQLRGRRRLERRRREPGTAGMGAAGSGCLGERERWRLPCREIVPGALSRC